jgi:hypothetical protein
MLLNFLENNLIFILILAIFMPISGVFLFKNPYKKLISLNCCLISMILLILILSTNSIDQEKILSILVAVIIIFATLMAIGIKIIKRIERL